MGESIGQEGVNMSLSTIIEDIFYEMLKIINIWVFNPNRLQ